MHSIKAALRARSLAGGCCPSLHDGSLHAQLLPQCRQICHTFLLFSWEERGIFDQVILVLGRPLLGNSLCIAPPSISGVFFNSLTEGKWKRFRFQICSVCSFVWYGFHARSLMCMKDPRSPAESSNRNWSDVFVWSLLGSGARGLIPKGVVRKCTNLCSICAAFAPGVCDVRVHGRHQGVDGEPASGSFEGAMGRLLKATFPNARWSSHKMVQTYEREGLVSFDWVV